MSHAPPQLHRDASNRLVFELVHIGAEDYRAIVEELVTRFDLAPIGPEIGSPDVVFREYHQSENVVGLEWDNWSGFIVVAKNETAEPLVREMATYLSTSRWSRSGR